MFEIKTVREKLVKQWRRYDFHQRWLTDSLRFPLQVPLPKITDRQLLHRFVDLQGQVIQFRQACEGLPGIEIIEKEFNFSSMGRQRIPTAIVVISLDDLCRFIGQKSHWDKFVNDVALLRRFFPQIEPWFVGNIPLIEQYHGDWLRLIQVCRYFLTTPRPGFYSRQLDIVGIDSKFIETHTRDLRQLLDFYCHRNVSIFAILNLPILVLNDAMVYYMKGQLFVFVFSIRISGDISVVSAIYLYRLMSSRSWSFH
ncbi:hypothetical protein N5H80_003570 [Salmonella enterica]|nr:hypothetical protein [Salmonella enterica subsp. diarizonae]EIE5009044.1 hypothetical protein [Salmonella enterica]EJU7198673.1 hypothetical protein [Salmonella enterica]EKC2495815.1 hypothetical protein [Salmonella enterica]EKK3317340.1 hypothetical protein [Salmonella enterica]